MRRGPQRFYQIKAGKTVYLLQIKHCTAVGFGNLTNAALRVNGDILKAYRKHLHRRSGQEMHVPNCELIRSHVKDRNSACPIYCKVIKEVFS